MTEQNEQDRTPGSGDPISPTATGPTQVEAAVPGAAVRAGKTGLDAADPPLAGSDEDPSLDPDEGADAFETVEEAERSERANAPERRDDDITDEIITVDTPD